MVGIPTVAAGFSLRVPLRDWNSQAEACGYISLRRRGVVEERT